MLQSQVDADRLTGRRQLFDLHFYAETHKIPARRITRQSNCFGLGAVRKRFGQSDPAELRQRELAFTSFGRAHVLKAKHSSVAPLFDPRIVGALDKEVNKGSIEDPRRAPAELCGR